MKVAFRALSGPRMFSLAQLKQLKALVLDEVFGDGIFTGTYPLTMTCDQCQGSMVLSVQTSGTRSPPQRPINMIRRFSTKTVTVKIQEGRVPQRGCGSRLAETLA